MHLTSDSLSAVGDFLLLISEKKMWKNMTKYDIQYTVSQMLGCDPTVNQEAIFYQDTNMDPKQFYP